MSYGANGTGLLDFAVGTLHKSTILDENGANHINFVDNLGNNIASITDSGGLALTTLMDYDATGRVISVTTPKTYNPPLTADAQVSMDLNKPGHSGQLDLTQLSFGSKALSVIIYAGYVPQFGPIGPLVAQNGITITFHIYQYKNGTLVKQSDELSCGDNIIDQYPYIFTYPNDPTAPTVAADIDEIKLVLDTVFYYGNTTFGELILDCVTISTDLTYAYNKRGLLEQKISPDAGTVNYLYDKNGNLRLTKDAAHTGSAGNSVYFNSNNAIAPYFASGQFTLGMPGRVSLSTRVYDIDQSEYITVRLKANGVILYQTSSQGWSGSSTTATLPKGTYTYEAQTTGSYGGFGYTVSCSTGLEFVYNKYDALNRVTEVGEYEASSPSADFTRTNANSVTFPSSGCVVTRSFLYDTVSTDPNASGQRNLRGKLSLATSYRLGTVAVTASYSYDSYGRVEWIVYSGMGTTSRKFNYYYDLQGNTIKKVFTEIPSSINTYNWWYQYDQAGRLARVYSGSDSTSRQVEARYGYTASGKILKDTLGATPAQILSYVYGERDWLKSISSTQFWEHLGYDTIAEVGTVDQDTAQYNGNISWMSYYESGNYFPNAATQTVGYGYKYDRSSRLISAGFGYLYPSSWHSSKCYSMPKIGYDKNGNIDTLARFADDDHIIMDRLKYAYLPNTNKLDSISDKVNAASFPDDIDNQRAHNYTYDGNGNMQKDSANGFAFIMYDINNLPVTEYRTNGAALTYSYDANGNRIQKLEDTTTTWYFNDAAWKTDVIETSSSLYATYNLWANDNVGQVKRSGTTLTRYYYLKDHLGDMKVTVNSSGGVDSYFDYYPFGQLMDSRNQTGSADGRYKYTGKERDVKTGYDYFGARYYDSRIGRWLSVDPMAERYLSLSPFSYSADNPIAFLDPNGKEVINHYYSAVRAFFGFLGVKQSTEYYTTQNLIDQARSLDPQLYSELDASPAKVEVGVGTVKQSESASGFREESTEATNVENNKATQVNITIDLDVINKASKSGATNLATGREVDPHSEPVLKVVHALAHAKDATTDFKKYGQVKEKTALARERKAFEKLESEKKEQNKAQRKEDKKR